MSAAGWLRTSVGRWAAPVLAVVVAIHVGTRNGDWHDEWLRGVLLLTFSCVFLGPMAAGFATWEGSRWARAQLPRSTGRNPGASVLRAWTALNAWLLATLVVAGVALLGAMKGLGMPGTPSGSDLLPLAAACALLLGWSTVGFAVGWRSGSTVLAAPLVAGGAFALTIALWAGPGRFMQVGGSFSSIVGLRVKPSVTAGQVLFWLGVILAGLAVIRLARRSWLLPALGVGLGLLLAVSGFRLTDRGDGLLFTAAPVTLRCAPLASGTDLCLAPGYERHRATAAAAVERAVGRWVAAGLAPPRRITQVARGRSSTTTWVDAGDLVHGDVNAIEWSLVNTPIPPSCDLYANPDAMQAFNTLQAAVVRDPEGTTVADRALQAPRPLERSAVAQVRAARATLQACGTRGGGTAHR